MHVVAAALHLALRMLPEPLLTYEKYHAFLAAARIVDASEVGGREGGMRE